VVVVVLVLVVVVGPVVGTAATSLPVTLTGGLSSGLEHEAAPKDTAMAISTEGTSLGAWDMAPTLVRASVGEQT
jgi:hypothetical protein